jgi:hypothetical protein
VAVTEGAQALYEARNEEAFLAAVEDRAQALYDAELKATLERDVMAKATSLAQAMFEGANAVNANDCSSVGNTADAAVDNGVVNNPGPAVVSEQISNVSNQFPKYNWGTLVLPNKSWIGKDNVVVEVLTSLSNYLRNNWHSDELAFIEKIGGNGENLVMNGLERLMGIEFFISVGVNGYINIGSVGLRFRHVLFSKSKGSGSHVVLMLQQERRGCFDAKHPSSTRRKVRTNIFTNRIMCVQYFEYEGISIIRRSCFLISWLRIMCLSPLLISNRRNILTCWIIVIMTEIRQINSYVHHVFGVSTATRWK